MIEQCLNEALQQLKNNGAVPADLNLPIQVTRSKDQSHGDFACNLAMMLAKPAKKNPREIAQQLCDALPENSNIIKTDIAGPGFINFFLKQEISTQIIIDVLKKGEQFGRSNHGQGQKTMVEFVSANPTGPLHVGHGRQAALGDAIAELLTTQGYDVKREFYYNDAGVQIQNLGLSVQARAKGLQPGDAHWPEQAYNGEYVQDIADDFLQGKTVQAKDGAAITANGNIDDLNNMLQFAVAYLRLEQDRDLEAFGVTFDHYYLESSLYTSGKVDDTVKGLSDSGKTYEQEGALWLKTCDYGDDKDRVMRKSDGNYTYFLPDVAYHVSKWQRGFRKVINVQGTDHFGTIARVRAGLQILNLGIPTGYPEYVLHNMVKVMRNGQEVKISKRAGSYVTVRDLIDLAGRDAVRFFLVSRKPEAQFVFDIDLALKQNDENPVYYVQYAHARIASVFRQLQDSNLPYDQENGLQHLNLLIEPHEEKLIKSLARYPELLTKAAINEEPHQITHYLRDLANEFHSYYNAHKFIIESQNLRNARLSLIKATQQVIANALHIIRVFAPDKM